MSKTDNKTNYFPPEEQIKIIAENIQEELEKKIDLIFKIEELFFKDGIATIKGSNNEVIKIKILNSEYSVSNERFIRELINNKKYSILEPDIIHAIPDEDKNKVEIKLTLIAEIINIEK